MCKGGVVKPVCVKCHMFYRVKKNGYYFLEGMPIPSDTPPGLFKPGNWLPYKLWTGDLWECVGCGSQLILGANAPISEHYMHNFPDLVEKLGADQFQVNDC